MQLLPFKTSLLINRLNLRVLPALFFFLMFPGCGKISAKADPTSISGNMTYGNLTISAPTAWSNVQVTITGTLTITNTGSLTLDRTSLIFSPAVEDTQSFLINGGTFVAKNASSIQSGTGKQWNLETTGACSVSFLGSSATNHSGMRMFDTCAFSADSSAVEEVQIHDTATASINNLSSAYLVLFFTGGGTTVTIPSGQLVSGSGITRSFTFPTSATTSGTVNITNSTVSGFQLDLVNNVILNVTNGTSIVLAMHLNNVGNSGSLVTIAANITSNAAATGTLDFSSYAGPKFNYTTTQISSFNVYLTGTSNVSFTGIVNVTEPDVGDSGSLTFGAAASVNANLAMTHGSGIMTFNGSSLIEIGSTPSFTAQDTSRINLNFVNATAGSKAYAVGQGQVHISGGSGWNLSKFENIGVFGGGGVFTP